MSFLVISSPFDLSGFSYDLRYLDDTKILENVICITRSWSCCRFVITLRNEMNDSFIRRRQTRAFPISCLFVVRLVLVGFLEQKAHNGGPNSTLCRHFWRWLFMFLLTNSLEVFLGIQKLQEWSLSIGVALWCVSKSSSSAQTWTILKFECVGRNDCALSQMTRTSVFLSLEVKHLHGTSKAWGGN